MRPNRRRAPDLGILLLMYQLFGGIGINRIPPVTLAFVGLQVSIYLRLFTLPWYKASQVCVGVYTVWHRKEYRRLLFGAFEHGDDWHLYYNMMSFVVKGQALERRFGSVKFLYLTSIFTVLTNVVLVGLSVLANEYVDNFERHCAVGFSGVIFALKVLTSYYYPNNAHSIMGIPIMLPANYAVWVELILIQVLIPNVSFVGHLAGILVGLAYVKGPLGPVLDTAYSAAKSILNPQPPRFAPRAEPTGFSHNTNRPAFHEYIPPGMTEEEQLRQAFERSRQETTTEDSAPPHSSSNLYPNLREIRNRRLEHYNN